MTPYSIDRLIDLERALCRSWDLDPFDGLAIEIALDVLHNALHPDPAVRPNRYIIERSDPRE